MVEQGLRGLTLTQPWASLFGRPKRIETRPWSTNYRGLVAIHAAKMWPRWAIEYCFVEPFRKALLNAGMRKPADVPRGAIVAVGELVHVGGIYRLTNEIRVNGCEWTVQPTEQEFGDYTQGRFAWVFTDITLLPEPIPCTGSQGLWTVPREIAAQVFAQTEGVSPCLP